MAHTQRRRLPAPWTVHETPSGFRVDDATGRTLAWVYGLAEAKWVFQDEKLTLDEARRIAGGIARLPELLARAKD